MSGKRGTQKNFTFIGKDKIKVEYELPLNEILWDFYDRLKSISKSYASMDYEFLGFRESDLVKLLTSSLTARLLTPSP